LDTGAVRLTKPRALSLFFVEEFGGDVARGVEQPRKFDAVFDDPVKDQVFPNRKAPQSVGILFLAPTDHRSESQRIEMPVKLLDQTVGGLWDCRVQRKAKFRDSRRGNGAI